MTYMLADTSASQSIGHLVPDWGSHVARPHMRLNFSLADPTQRRRMMDRLRPRRVETQYLRCFNTNTLYSDRNFD